MTTAISKYQDIKEQRALVLANHTEDLLPKEMMIAQAATKDDIATERAESEPRLIDKVATLITYLAKDVGIKNIEQYTTTRIYDILTKYYSDLTISEIKIAFEILMLGDIDAWLPKDQHGNPNRNHYQEFSIEYLTKVLNAYRRKRAEINVKVDRLLPEPPDITEQDKLDNIEYCKKEIERSYAKYKETGTMPEIFIPHIYIRYLKEYGVLPEIKLIQRNRNIAEVLKHMGKSTISDHSDDIKRYGMETPIMKTKELDLQELDTIRDGFDQLISEGREIEWTH